MTSKQVGFVGLGAMGAGMATNLQRYLRSQQTLNQTMMVFNRDASKCEPLTSNPELSSQKCDTLAQLSDACGIIFTMLAEDTAVKSVVQQLLCRSGSHQGKVIIDCSTVLPETTQQLVQEAESRGAHYLAAPVFGRYVHAGLPCPATARPGTCACMHAGHVMHD